MELEGKQLGHYRLRNILGSGGMGDVYLAEDLTMPRHVAIKIVRGMSVNDQDALRLFTREMRAIAILDHPHILAVIDFGEETIAGAVITYLVMPYRPEGSLEDWLRRQQERQSAPPTPAEIVQLIQQAASALQHAHDHHILHLDVKASNFLVRELAEHPRVPNLLLADFGISRFSTGGVTSSSTSGQGVRGSPIAMAPERWEGRSVPASDQYALAVMAYQLLTGKPPFSGGVEGMMYQHFATFPSAPSQVNPQLSRGSDAVILRALAKHPDQRFPSVAALAQALQQAVSDSSGIPRGTTEVAASLPSYPGYPPPPASSHPGYPSGAFPSHPAYPAPFAPSLQAYPSVTPPPPGFPTAPAYGQTWPSSPYGGPTYPPAPPHARGPKRSWLLPSLLILLLLLASVGVIVVVHNYQSQTSGSLSVATNPPAQTTATVSAPTPTSPGGKQPALAPGSSFASIAGNYSGTLANASGISAGMTLVIQQQSGTLTGTLTDYPPLAPSHGAINGTTGADPNGYAFVQFVWQAIVQNGECGQVCLLDFRGYLYTDGSLGGTYTIEQDHESGTWTAAK